MGRLARFVARVLDSDTIKEIAPRTYLEWRNTTAMWRDVGYREGKTPPTTGDLLVQSPYNQWYNLTWGIAPNADMPRWRWLYRARPEVRRGVDIKVMLAVGRGFSVVADDDDEVEQYVAALLHKMNTRELLQSAVTDMLVYGQAYFEKVRALPGEEQEQEQAEIAPLDRVESKKAVTRKWTASDLDDEEKPKIKEWQADVNNVDAWMAQQKQENNNNNKNHIGELIELKPLDPMWMRVNRDAFNNIMGFVQWGLETVPQSIEPQKVVFLRWLPKSWSNESAYGTSMLMPILRHISFLIQAEEDMKVWIHQYAKPMLVVKGGRPEAIYPAPKLASLRDSFASRGPNTDAIVPGDVDVQVIQGGTGQTSASVAEWVRYLMGKIYEAMGVPSILMGLQISVNRASADIELEGFIAEERMIQEIVGEQFMKQVIEPEVRRKFGVNRQPKLQIVWPPIIEDDKNKRMDRVTKAIGKPWMSVNEGRKETGLLPRDDDKYDEISEAPAPDFGQFSKPEESESGRTGVREEKLQQRDKG